MSRRMVTGAATRTTATEILFEVPSDSCPVCKRNRYLNPNLEFLINPECYHPMCSNCVTNIFSKGPAQCPYATCGKTLRQRGFRSAFFKDLTIEREVDIRHRVQAVFNNTQDDFETLRDYNDYLQQVEDLTFDLVQSADTERRAKAEQELLAYEQKHAEEIEKNKKRGREAESQRRQREAANAEAAKQRRLEEQREEERARAEEKTINAEVMEALARGEPGSAAEITARIVAAKRARVAEIAGAHFPSLLDASKTSGNSSLLSIRGLKDKNAARREDDEYYLKPYDAFAGLDLAPTRYTLAADGDGYDHPWLEDARTRDDHRVPGYSTREYAARAVFEAFAGLGVVVADEKADAQRAAGTKGAEMAAETGRTGGMGKRMDVDDVFV